MKSALIDNESRESVYRIPGLPGIELKCVSNSLDYEPHFHGTYTFGILTCGAQILNTDNKTNNAYQGSVQFIEPYQVHENRRLTDAKFSFRHFEIAPEQLICILEDQNPPGLYNHIEDLELYHLLYRVFDVISNNDNELANEVSITAAMNRMFNTAEISKRLWQTGINSRLVSRVREYLHAEYLNQVKLESLAEHMQVSRVHVSRIFKKHIGIPPHEYLIQLRVNGAKTMLAAGVSPTEAALSNGFTDQSHLTRHFKRITHMTPAIYANPGYKRTRR